MGAVYKAFDTELERAVALKIVRPELAANPDTMQRFKQELLLASQISHKNILRIYDLGDSDGVKFFTMAFVDGADLATVMEGARGEGARGLPLDRAINFARQLCSALDAAHTEGIIHRDLKPQNILVDRTDTLYVSDFGLAKSLAPETSSMTRTGQLLGTPRYMSPEQVEGKEIDHRSDIYAFGLILFEMFTGELPFRGDSALQIMFQRVTSAPKDPKASRPGLPDYLAKVILKCLERTPEKRYQSSREVLADITVQITPERGGLMREHSIHVPSRMSWAVPIGILLALALWFSLARVRRVYFASRPASLSSQTAIAHYLAVLPLQLVGNQQDAPYLASGISDVLTTRLSGFQNLYVAPSNTVSTAIKLKDPQKIVRALGVQLLLDGTLATSSNGDIAIVIRLHDQMHGRDLLHQAFQGNRENLLTLEDQIFEKVLASLEIKETAGEQAHAGVRPTQNIEAYEFYMKGRDLWQRSDNVADLHRAIDLFAEAIKRDPQFALAYAGVADAERRMWVQTNDGAWTEKALAAAQRAQALNDNLAEVHFTLGSIYTNTGRTAEAVSELKRALQLAPNSDEALRRLGNVYMQSGQVRQAMAAFGRATQLNPYLWTNSYSLGNAYLRIGQNESALAAYQHIIQLNPNQAEGWESVGLAYFQMGRWAEALSRLKRAVDLRPEAFFLSNLGTTLFFLGKYKESADVFEKAVSTEPEDDGLRLNLADAYRWSGQAAKALLTYDQTIALAFKSIRINPRNAAALGNLAVCYAKKGDRGQALRFIARAREIDPRDNTLMYEQATIFALAGQSTSAMTSLQEALRNGYPLQEARSDPELATLRRIPEFSRLGNGLSQTPVR